MSQALLQMEEKRQEKMNQDMMFKDYTLSKKAASKRRKKQATDLANAQKTQTTFWNQSEIP